MYILLEENAESRKEIKQIKATLKFYADTMSETQKQSELEEIARLEKCIRANERHMERFEG